ncbi:uncharacterized protein LOC110324344 [Mus pahari]|uniref:uncharacterized protein LOC110324344 n=1 Tax=Mus pahari TaxID=10093 RepID=UPI000A31424B|nr:uncharacterized protein LOC110324344 [Mus pahari]
MASVIDNTAPPWQPRQHKSKQRCNQPMWLHFKEASCAKPLCTAGPLCPRALHLCSGSTLKLYGSRKRRAQHQDYSFPNNREEFQVKAENWPLTQMYGQSQLPCDIIHALRRSLSLRILQGSSESQTCLGTSLAAWEESWD